MNNNIQILSPAKINFSLHIGKYSDEKKKHELESEMMKISLADEIEIEVTEKKKIQIIVKGDYAKGVPNNNENIVYKAIDLFFARRPRSIGLKITLTKNIPNGAGLGGGSSNAAEIIKFLHEYYSVPLEISDYVNLGSDIPFFLGEKTTGKVSGIGEKIEPIEKGQLQGCSPTEEKYKFGILFLFPKLKISTKWAFEQLKFLRENKREYYKLGNGEEKNDFQEMVFSYFFDIKKTFEEIQKYNPHCSGLSGTGSTLFAFFNTKKECEKVITQYENNDGVQVIKIVTPH